MKREEAINIVRNIYQTDTEKEALQVLIPELRESEDERMMGVIRLALTDVPEERFTTEGTSLSKVLAWLEKQKECGEANFREGYLHGFEDAQKEQKPVPINSDDKYMLERIMALIEFCDDKEIIWSWLCEKVKVATQKPAEWSEEDETCLTNTLIMLKEYAIHHYSKDDVNKSVNWLENRVKFLRPQSHKETYQAAKHDLAIRFMNYLDENRPEGKMSLSNGECEDIDKAFKENDWTKIMQYAKKYLIQSEQQPVEWSEEDKKILLSIIKAFRNGSVSTIGQEQWLKSLPERLNLQPQAKQGQKPLEYLTKKKINSIMSKLTNLSFSKLIPFNSEEYKKIDEITSDVCGLLDYPIEQKPAEWSEDDSIKIAKLREIFFDYAWHIDALDRNQDLTGEYAELDNWLGTLPERFNLQPKNEWS